MLLLAFAIPGLLILALGALFARSRLMAIVFGVVGSLFIAVQCLIVFVIVGMSHSWSGDSGNGWVPIACALGGILAVIIYFVVTFSRMRQD